MADSNFVVKNTLVVNTSFIANSSQVTLGTINATSTGVFVNTSVVTVGNSSVNVSVNSTSFSGTALFANISTYSNSSIYANNSYTNTFTIGSASYFVANGNMGIGTQTPYNKLVIIPNTNTNDGLTVYNANTGASAQAVIALNTAGASGVSLGQNYTTKNAFVYLGDNASLTFSTNTTAAMTIAANSNVGIGTSTPSAKFHVEASTTLGSGNLSAAEFHGGGSGSNGGQIRLYNSYSGVTLPSKWLRVDNNGIFGIINNAYNTALATVDDSGNFTALQNVTAYSDARLKTNVETIDNALDKVSRMRGVTYERIDSGSKGVGVIAQEMQEVLPEVVMDNGDHLSVAYGNIVGVLIEAIKELKAEIEQLKGN